MVTLPYPGMEGLSLREENVFCGKYSVIVCQEVGDMDRVVDFNGGHSVVTGASSKAIRVFDIHTGKHSRDIIGHAGSVQCVYVNEALNLVVSGSYDTSVRRWDLATGQCKGILRGHKSTVTCIGFDPSLMRLASGGKDKTLRIWALEAGKSVAVFAVDGVVTALRVNDGLAACGTDTGSACVYDMRTASQLRAIPAHGGTVHSLDLDCRFLITGGADRAVHVWLVAGENGDPALSLRHTSAVLCVRFARLRIITGAEVS